MVYAVSVEEDSIADQEFCHGRVNDKVSLYNSFFSNNCLIKRGGRARYSKWEGGPERVVAGGIFGTN